MMDANECYCNSGASLRAVIVAEALESVLVSIVVTMLTKVTVVTAMSMAGSV